MPRNMREYFKNAQTAHTKILTSATWNLIVYGIQTLKSMNANCAEKLSGSVPREEDI